jgi:threonine synthase
LPKLNVVQAEGSAPLASLFASLGAESSHHDAALPSTMAPVAKPRTLATAIKIGAPVSWQKSLRAVLRSHGQVIAVSEQEIADAKAMIGRDGIGCEPASATTVAGIRKLVAAGRIHPEEEVFAVLTGHVLKDPDYVNQYHRGTLSMDSDKGPQPINGSFRNVPRRVAATKAAVLQSLEKRN